MSEFTDWRREEVLEHMPKGWQVVEDVNHKETLRTDNGSILTFEDAYAIHNLEYNRGYDRALEHIKSVCVREMEDV